jgi:hypothetical protein
MEVETGATHEDTKLLPTASGAGGAPPEYMKDESSKPLDDPPFIKEPIAKEPKKEIDPVIVFKAIREFVADLGSVWGKSKWYGPVNRIVNSKTDDGRDKVIHSFAMFFHGTKPEDLPESAKIELGRGTFFIPIGKLIRTEHKPAVIAHLNIISALLEGAVVMDEKEATEELFASLTKNVEGKMKGKSFKNPGEMIKSVLGDETFFESITQSIKGITGKTSNPKKVLKGLHAKLGKIIDEDD